MFIDVITLKRLPLKVIKLLLLLLSSSQALSCTASGASGEDSRTLTSVAPKDQLTHTSSGDMIQMSIHYLAVGKKFLGEHTSIFK